jgi:hypothetical protein
MDWVKFLSESFTDCSEQPREAPKSQFGHACYIMLKKKRSPTYANKHRGRLTDKGYSDRLVDGQANYGSSRTHASAHFLIDAASDTGALHKIVIRQATRNGPRDWRLLRKIVELHCVRRPLSLLGSRGAKSIVGWYRQSLNTETPIDV